MPDSFLKQIVSYELQKMSSTQSELSEVAKINPFYLSRILSKPVFTPIKVKNREILIKRIVKGLINLHQQKYGDENLVQFEEDVNRDIRFAVEKDMQNRIPAFLNAKANEITEERPEIANKERIGVIIAGAGFGERMEGVDKIFSPIGNPKEPVLVHVIDVFEHCSLITDIVVVVQSDNIGLTNQLIKEKNFSKVFEVCKGGPRRQDSVKLGLDALPKGCNWVVIQDAARPFVTAKLITQVLGKARETGAAIAAVPVTDTIKIADENNKVQATPPRGMLWAAQTPQIFSHSIITKAYKLVKYYATDDSMLVERDSGIVNLCMGSYENIKITFREDLILADYLMKQRNESFIKAEMNSMDKL
jgi:2-C-methyl-D-erythritol 4-phosphate cytidylyltransferase